MGFYTLTATMDIPSSTIAENWCILYSCGLKTLPRRQWFECIFLIPVNPPPSFGAHVCIQFYSMFILLSVTFGSRLIMRLAFVFIHDTKMEYCVNGILLFSIFHCDQQLVVCAGSTGVSVDVQVMKQQTAWSPSFFPFIIIEIFCTKTVCKVQVRKTVYLLEV